MKYELENKLFETYPIIFKEKDMPMSETCMCWGCECDDGWYPLINDLCSKLQIFYEKHQLEVNFVQVKEKYGTLRIYYNMHFGAPGDTKLSEYFNGFATCYGSDIKYDDLSNYVKNLIDFYTSISSIVCERCGMTGAANRKICGWWTTLCERCYNENINASETVYEPIGEKKKGIDIERLEDNGTLSPENGHTN
jgi:hypothetical protein